MAVIKTTPNTTGSAPRPTPPQTLTKTPSANRAGVSARPGATRTTQAAPKSSRDFLSDTQSELRKVVWPTREEVRSGTIVTVLLLIVFGAYVFGLDTLIGKVFESLLYGGVAAPTR